MTHHFITPELCSALRRSLSGQNGSGPGTNKGVRNLIISGPILYELQLLNFPDVS